MKILKLLLIDENMNSAIIEINSLQFKSLGIDLSKVKKHEKKRDLNTTITNYLKELEENKSEI